MIGSDYDQTYDKFPELHGKVDVVITGKGWNEFKDVDPDTKLDVPVFFNPMKHEDIVKGYPLTVVNHKANIINKTGITTFYEDQQEEINLLKLFCSNCKFILMK